MFETEEPDMIQITLEFKLNNNEAYINQYSIFKSMYALVIILSVKSLSTHVEKTFA